MVRCNTFIGFLILNLKLKYMHSFSELYELRTWNVPYIALVRYPEKYQYRK